MLAHISLIAAALASLAALHQLPRPAVLAISPALFRADYLERCADQDRWERRVEVIRVARLVYEGASR
jgi:hypothetical protein